MDKRHRIESAIGRALEEFDAGKYEIAVVSFLSDLMKDEDTATYVCVEAGVLLLNAIPDGREVFEATMRRITTDIEPHDQVNGTSDGSN